MSIQTDLFDRSLKFVYGRRFFLFSAMKSKLFFANFFNLANYFDFLYFDLIFVVVISWI